MGLPFSAIVKYVMGGFNPLSWFSKGEQGAWYDPSDLTTLFQDSAGVTPMSAVGTVADQPVGLMLDKSKGLALGAELVTTPYSAVGANWSVTVNTISRASGGTLASGTLTSCPASVAGKAYLIKFTASGLSGATCYMNYGAISSSTALSRRIAVAGNYSFIIISEASSQPTFIPYEGSDFAITIDNISIKQIAGNHAFQATAGNRPLLSSRVNALLNTEGVFANTTYWVSQTTTVDNIAIAPNGTLTASRLTTTGASNYVNNNGTNNPVSPPVGITHTLTIWVRLVSGTGTFRMYANSPGFSPTQTATAEWKQFSFTFTPVLVVTTIRIFQTYTAGDVVEIWGADLRPTNSGALLPPYQRVNTASDYDTVGFPLYLKANGTSSAMSTNSIDFTGTDKMTVVTGVRKTSGNTNGWLMELSADNDVNGGAFRMQTGTSDATYRTQLGDSVLRKLYDVSVYAAPINNVITNGLAFSPTNLLDIRINGSAPTTISKPYDSTLPTRNFGNYPLFLFARAGTSLFLNGQFYGAIIRGAQSDTASVTQTEQYMATKTGITF